MSLLLAKKKKKAWTRIFNFFPVFQISLETLKYAGSA